MQARQFGRSLPQILLAVLLVSCSPTTVFAETNSLSQENAAPANFEDLAKSAAAARDTGRTDDAIRDYKRALEIRADWAEGWWYLGTMEYDRDRYAEAILAFQKLVQLAPAAGPGWNFLGLCEFETKDYENSLEHLKKGQALGDADDPEISRVAKYHLALLLVRSGEFDPATTLLASTFGQSQISPQVKTALGLAILHVPLLPGEVDPSQDALLRSAGEAGAPVAQGDTSKALESFRALTKTFPHSAAAHAALGRALQAAGEKEKADEELVAAKKLAPEKFLREENITQLDAHHAAANKIADARSAAGNSIGASTKKFEELSRRAAEAQAAGQTELAIQSFQQALQIRPEWDDGRWNLAMLCYSTAKYPDAISALKSWVERKPNFGTAWAVMGLSEFELKDYGNALVHLQRGEELGFGGSPESVRFAKYHLGLLLIRDGQFENAAWTLVPEAGSGALAKKIEFALGMALLHMPVLPEQVEPVKTSMVQTAGQISVLLQDSKYDQAFPKFQALLKEFPSEPFLHYAYGTAFAALSQYDEAETEFHAELKISPASELPYVRLASLQLKKHQPAPALPFAQTAVKLSPGSGEAHYLLGRAALELGQEETAVRELETASKLVPGSPEVHFNLAKAYGKAKLAEKAEQERAIFARLNALAEEQRSHTGNQAYRGSHKAAELVPARVEAEKTAKPDHPL
jgi:tetratricopeptide (TPR) repeat protein